MLDYAFVADSITYFLLLSKEHKMSKLTVKIKRTTLIPKLQEALNAMDARKAQFDKDVKAFVKASEAHKVKLTDWRNKIRNMTPAALAKILADAPKSAVNTEANDWANHAVVCVNYSVFDAALVAPQDPAELPENRDLKNEQYYIRGSGGRYHTTSEATAKRAAIQNAINILNLSEDDFVPTSTYNEVAKFL